MGTILECSIIMRPWDLICRYAVEVNLPKKEVGILQKSWIVMTFLPLAPCSSFFCERLALSHQRFKITSKRNLAPSSIFYQVLSSDPRRMRLLCRVVLKIHKVSKIGLISSDPRCVGRLLLFHQESLQLTYTQKLWHLATWQWSSQWFHVAFNGICSLHMLQDIKVPCLQR